MPNKIGSGPQTGQIATCGSNAGFFPIKVVLWVVLCIISFYAVEVGALYGFFQFARVLAAVFLLLQLVVVLETVFRLNEVSTTSRTIQALLSLCGCSSTMPMAAIAA